MSGRRRWVARLLLATPLSLTLLVAVAPSASAHAELARTSPAAGSVIESSPRQISLAFDEAVFSARDAIHLYDDHFAAVEVGPTSHPGGAGKVVAASVPEALRAGTYTVTWRVTSDDGHVVAGQFVFSVGHATAVTGLAPGTRHNSTTSILAAVARGIGYVGLIAGPGALVVAAWLWPGGFARRRFRLLLYAGGGLLVVASAVAVWVQGAAAAGDTLGSALSRADLRLGMAGRFGRAAAGRVVLLVALAWFAVRGKIRRDRVPAGSVSLVAAALVATWPYGGHAGVGDLVPLAFVADWVHVAAMATWLGGLTMFLVGPLWSSRDSHANPETFPILASLSEWALNAVTLLVATGLFSAWRNVRSFGALTATHYGRLLLWKTAAVVVVLVVARISRRHAEGLDRRGEAPLPLLRRTVLAEAGGTAVVLAITAFLTGTAQAVQTYAPAFTRSATENGITVTVHADRTGVGPTDLTVSASRSGEAVPVTSVDGTLSEADPPVGPLPLVFRAAGPGRAVTTVTFPDAGDWSLSLDVFTSPSHRITVATTIRVRD